MVVKSIYRSPGLIREGEEMAYISATHPVVNHLDFSNPMFSIYRHYKAKLPLYWMLEEKGAGLVDAVADPTQAVASANPRQYSRRLDPNNSKVFSQASPLPPQTPPS